MKRPEYYLGILIPKITKSFPVTVDFVNKDYLQNITNTNFSVQGLFNDSRILLLDTMSPEKQLFTLIHIAGHYVQWKDSVLEKEYSFSFQQDTNLKSNDEIQKHHKHEIDSIEYSLKFLHEQNITDLDSWFKESFKKDQEEINDYFRSISLKESIGEFDKNFVYIL